MPSFIIEKTDFDTILHNKYGVYSKKELEFQLKEGRLTVEELGSIYGLNNFRINHVIRALSIDYRNPISVCRAEDTEITPSMRQVILGTIMGDACIKDESYYSLGHSVNQTDYFYHTAERLKHFVSAVDFKKHLKKNTLDKFDYSLELRTLRHPIFNEYFKKFYSKGKNKKYFSLDAYKDITEEGLAYWFMDDGKIHKDRNSYYLCTGKISLEEVSQLSYFLNKKFGLNTNPQNHDISKGYIYIYIPVNNKDKFINIIEPYIIPSMRYKIEGTSQKVLEDFNFISSRHIELCTKLRHHIKFKGNEKLEKIINRETFFESTKSVYIEDQKRKTEEGKLVSKTAFRRLPDKQKLIELFNKGMTDKEVAEMFGFGRNRIARERKKLGIERKFRRENIRNNKVKFPCLDVKLVSTAKIKSNEYNPNKVADKEMDLLIKSIEEDGVTQPIVVFYDKEKDEYEVIDGFHRYTVLKDHFKITKIPVVVLDQPLGNRMASTIRHNRARGKHLVELMSSLVLELSSKGWNDEAISKHLGMEGEEIFRLRNQMGCASFLSNKAYSKSWEVQ